jgi:hypothetical protein
MRAPGHGGVTEDAGPYAAWVLRLRTWRVEPETTSLDGLPAVSEETFDRATFQLFTAQLSDAIAAFMKRWDGLLHAAFARAHDPHALAVELVGLRRALRPRLALARHPGLPEPIRTALADGLSADLASIQQQLEDVVRAQSARGSVDLTAADAMLRIVRDNPLTGVLTESDDAVATPSVAASAAPPPPPVPPRRQIIFPASQRTD